MPERVRRRWRGLTQSLGFVPGLLVAAFAAAGVVLVEIDNAAELSGSALVFQGDAAAARTVLSVIAGSLITVAGLTFSITMVVLQLASSQFSPRVLRTFFGDRITQVTIGTYVGIFVYSLLVLRAVGSFGDSAFVPRLSVSFASLMGVGAVILLIVFLNHVSRMVQVSHVMAAIAGDTLARTDRLFPDGFGEPLPEDAAGVLREWRSVPPGAVYADRAGFVQGVALEAVEAAAAGSAERVGVLVCPGDFVGPETVVAEVWPAGSAEACGKGIRQAIAVADERDLDQDAGFGLRQLTDIAVRAMSPGINDPATAVTAIGYVRSILVRLTARAEPPGLRTFPDRGLAVAVRRRAYREQLESLVEVGRYARADASVASAVLEALLACDEAARRCGAGARRSAIREVAAAVAEGAGRELAGTRDRHRIEALMARFEAAPQGRELRPRE